MCICIHIKREREIYAFLHRMLHMRVCTYKEKLPGPTITAKRCTQFPNRCGCCFILSVHWPFVVRFGTQGATLHAKFYAEYFPSTVSKEN